MRPMQIHSNTKNIHDIAHILTKRKERGRRKWSIWSPHGKGQSGEAIQFSRQHFERLEHMITLDDDGLNKECEVMKNET